MNSRGWMIRVCAVAAMGTGLVEAVAESVVHDTSAEFAGGTFLDTEDTGSGSNPALRIVYNLPFGFGDGRSGSATISSDPNTRGSCSGNIGTTTLTTGLDATPGDVILVHQSRGTGAGNWELNKVVSDAGLSLTLSNPLAFTYTDGGNSQAQAILVPQYTAVTINGGGPSPWDGNTGGIYAALCSGTINITATMTASGRGYLGGNINQPVEYGGADASGEGTVGASVNQSYAANGNGGGGGDCERNGEPARGGGGGGGHGTSGASGTSFNGGPVGAGGGTAGTANLSNMVFGGGGGSSDKTFNDGYSPGNGGNGGGLFLLFGSTVNVTAAITAHGNDGGGGIGAGAGAGGAVLIKGRTVSLGSGNVSAVGGSGGSGGNGGVGRIRAEFGSGGLTGSTNPTASSAPLDFKTSGTYRSPAINIAGAAIMGQLQWAFTAGTDVQIRTRTASTPGGLSGSPWSAYLTNPAGSQIASAADEYIQYEALFTGAANDAPTLTSVTINYTTIVPPTVTQDPQSQSICGGSEAVFSVSVSGDAPFNYQWRKDGGDLTNGGHYAGADTDTLSVSMADAGDEGDYDCVISNGGGADTSGTATLSVDTTDSDSDGTADCADDCPNDAAKTAVGECGCGTPEDDADGDGTPDCNDVDRLLHFQGKLRLASGAAVEGAEDLTFRFYDAESAGNLLFTETQAGVAITRVLFSVILGSQTTGGVPDTAVDRKDAWVSVAVDGGAELSPRSRVPAEPYVTKALASEKLVKPGTLNPAVTVNGSGDIFVAGNILASGSITPGSSRRLKENIRVLCGDEARAVLLALGPVKFTYKADAAADDHVGFIAEDVPDLVAAANRRGVDPMDIVAVLTRVVQQQQAQLEQDRALIQRLLDDNDEHHREIDQLCEETARIEARLDRSSRNNNKSERSCGKGQE